MSFAGLLFILFCFLPSCFSQRIPPSDNLGNPFGTGSVLDQTQIPGQPIRNSPFFIGQDSSTIGQTFDQILSSNQGFSSNINPVFDAQFISTFNRWKAQFGRTYKDSQQELYRMIIFWQNFQKVNMHNAKPSTYKLAMNKFADLAPKQFSAKYGGLLTGRIEQIQKRREDEAYLKQLKEKCPCNDPAYREVQNRIKMNTALEDAYREAALETGFPEKSGFNNGGNRAPVITSAVIDWTSYTPNVVDQGECRACYAISTAHSIAANYRKNYNTYIQLSIQQLIDCTNGAYNGCNGGFLSLTFDFAKYNGLVTSSVYPEVSGQTQSNNCLYPNGNFKITSVIQISNNCNLIKLQLGYSPVSASISSQEIQLLGSGIFYGCTGPTINIDHAVLIVFYSSSSQAWKIKNSWGSDWAQNGFAWITGNQYQNCGLCKQAVGHKL